MSDTVERFPAEWEPHRAVIVAWPWDESLWEENLAPAQSEFLQLLNQISDERLVVLAANDQALNQAQAKLKHLEPAFHLCPYGDIWLRDTAPLFFKQGDRLIAKTLKFNGWGEKYQLPLDSDLSRRIAEGFKASRAPELGALGLSQLSIEAVDWLGEGGALEFDGQGTVLTSRQCLLNPNRKGPKTEKEVEARLKSVFGVQKVIWVTEGMINDHTDGHIDTIARFVAPAEVAVHQPVSGDPNEEIYRAIISELEGQTDAQGRRLKLHLIPSAGEVKNEDGDFMPASHLNFYIANRSVVVPTYGTASGPAAVRRIAQIFPGRKTVGVSSMAILSGGGSFHCITQQIPL